MKTVSNLIFGVIKPKHQFNKMKNLYLLFILALFFSCSSENENVKLYGNWQGISWEVNGKASGLKASNLTFDFNVDDSYELNFETQQEKGAYKLKGSKLYTTEKGKQQKVVGVSFVGTDTLEMDMNRAGDEELLVLVRRK